MAFPISIDKLINGNVVENQRIEYRNGWDPEPILHSICAFANDFEGYSGVSDASAKQSISIVENLFRYSVYSSIASSAFSGWF